MGNTNIISFNNKLFGEVRFIDVEGKPYAVAVDVATALGYRNSRKALKDHCRHVTKRYIPHPQSANKQMELNVIPEGDIYRLIMKSRLPQAEKFESWVMEEVLPQIRKTGGYIPVKEKISDIEIMSQALAIAQRTINNFDDILKLKDQQIEIRNKIIKEQEPKVIYADNVLGSHKLISSTDVAKDLGMTANKLHKILNRAGYIYKRDRGCWKFYAKYEGMVPEYADYHINEYAQSLKWTEKGRKFIIDLINNDAKIKQIIADIENETKESKNKKNKA